MTPLPRRLQLSRKRGFNLQALSRSVNGLDAVNCARPSRWKNPWRVGDSMYDSALKKFRKCKTVADCIFAFRQCIDWDPNAKTYLPTLGEDGARGVLEIWGGYGPYHRNRVTARRELAGKNLACWCPIESPCHCDVLLVLANAPVCEEVRA